MQTLWRKSAAMASGGEEMMPIVTSMRVWFNTAIVRGIMLKGYALGDLWPQVVALGIVGVILYTLAANRLRKGLD